PILRAEDMARVKVCHGHVDDLSVGWTGQNTRNCESRKHGARQVFTPGVSAVRTFVNSALLRPHVEHLGIGLGDLDRRYSAAVQYGGHILPVVPVALGAPT